MTALEILDSLSVLFNLAVDCRFLNRALGAKRPLPIIFVVTLFYDFILGECNITFHLAGTIIGNTFYYCLGNLLLYRFLYHGTLMKQAFFTALLSSCITTFFYVLFPLDYAFLAWQDSWPGPMSVIMALNWAALILKAILLEFAGRRFQNLRGDLPWGYFPWLAATVFVIVASVSVTELSLFAAGDDPLSAALFSSLLSAVGTFFLFFSSFDLSRQITLALDSQWATLQAAHFKSRETDLRHLTRFRHDMKNHLLCLDGLLREGKSSQAARYLDTLSQALERLDRRIATGNDFADAILNEKYAQALSLDIAFTADMAIPAECAVEPVDLCCILGNALDNALEACRHVTQGGKWIEARAFSRQGQLVLTIRNSIGIPVETHQGRVVNQRREALGMENISRAVERCGGAFDVTAGDCFTFSVMLPIGIPDPGE